MKKAPQGIKVALAAFVILFCAGTALSMFRDSLERTTGRSNLTPIFSYLERHGPGHPRVIFLGSSRFVSCIKSDLFAELSGAGSSSVLNLAADSGGTWEELLVLRKYPGLLDSSPAVVIEVEPWMFNKNMKHIIHKTPYPFEAHFYTWATFQERLEYPDLKTKSLLLADYFWPFSERRPLVEWGSAIRLLLLGKEVEPKLSEAVYHKHEWAYKALLNTPTFQAPLIAHDHLNNFEFDEYKARHLRRLVGSAQKKTGRIVLLQPPVRKEYMDVIYMNPGYLATYRKCLQFIHGLENEKVRSIIWETPKDCGLNDSIFIDYGHFSKEGAYKFSRRLYSELENMGVIRSGPLKEN